MMTTWFTSDTHFGHQNVIKYCDRPFHNAYEMDYALIELWNKSIQPDDEVFFLGDFAMNKIFVPKIMSKLNGIKILIAGNHDTCFKEVYGISQNAAKPKTQFYLASGFASVHKTMNYICNGATVILNHFPYYNTEATDQRYAEYRPMDQGLYLLHGHSHNPPERRHRGRMLDVGVDGHHYKPWSLEEIITELAL